MVLILRVIRRHGGLCYLGENADDVTGFTAPITVSVDDVVTFELDGTASNTWRIAQSRISPFHEIGSISTLLNGRGDVANPGLSTGRRYWPNVRVRTNSHSSNVCIVISLTGKTSPLYTAWASVVPQGKESMVRGTICAMAQLYAVYSPSFSSQYSLQMKCGTQTING
jgi:hypothetical protein